jgi:hypothetical protein
VDRVHHERALHRRERAQPRVAALELLHHEPVGDVVHARAAVAGQVRAEQSQLGDPGHELHRERPVAADVLLDPRQELARHPVADGVAREPLLVGEQLVDVQEVESREVRHAAKINEGPGSRGVLPGP